MDADLADLDEFMAQSNAKARRGRRIARLIFAEGVSFVPVAGFVMIIAASNQRGSLIADPGLTPWIAPSFGVLGILVGLAWMVRILRADPEPDSSAWRYRDR
jgi:type IV secretory pathway TrbD component